MILRRSRAAWARRVAAVIVPLLVLAVSSTAVVLAPTLPAHAAPGPELVKNHTFSNGTQGWRTNGSGEELRGVTVAGLEAARLTTDWTKTAVVNDLTNTVENTGSPGKTYRAEARVRTSTPGVAGALRIREVIDNEVKTHATSFTLTGTDWKTVNLRVLITNPNAHLDLNVVAYELDPGQTLFVDLVSLKHDGEAAPAPAPGPGNQCESAVPSGTSFGASIYPVGITPAASLSRIDSAFGRVPIVRDFYPSLPPNWGSRRAQLLADRDSVISFRASPQSVLSGRHDAFFKNWFATAPRSKTIYWSYMHEPESEVKNGEFTKTQYRAAWRRLDGFADRACKPNMHATLILSDWTVRPEANRNYRDYDAGKDVVDVLAFDPYNRIFQPNSREYDSPQEILGPIVNAMKADGRPYGLAEIGSRRMVGDQTGSGRAQWLNRIATYAVQNDAAFVTYFQATVKGDWPLRDSPSQQAWRNIIQANL